MKKYLEFIADNTIYVEMRIPNDIIEISKEFNKAGKDLFVVGGAVRDFLQQKVPHDFDLVTNALPEESKKILNNWNVSDEQGKSFGVLRIYTKNEPLGHELATYRHDISGGRDTKGDDKKVEIGNNITINDDCKRRDLTQNALYYNIDKKEIVDLVGGVKDIENNVIRAVGDASERFKEDRLRILRVFRFAARAKGRKGGIISPETSKAIRNDNRLRGVGPKDDVSQERIHEEWNKVIEHAEKNGHKIINNYIDLLFEYDMWEQMFPKLKITKQTVTTTNSVIIFSSLLWNNDISKMKKYMVRELKFNSKLVNQIEFLVKLGDELEISSDDYKYVDTQYIYKLAKMKVQYDIDDYLIIDFLGDGYSLFIDYCNDGFIINGNDLAAEGFKGREIEKEKERREIERFRSDYLEIQ
jgi:tRNA nucleotidyltransferase/poly(A) polymerase